MLFLGTIALDDGRSIGSKDFEHFEKTKEILCQLDDGRSIGSKDFDTRVKEIRAHFRQTARERQEDINRKSM